MHAKNWTSERDRQTINITLKPMPTTTSRQPAKTDIIKILAVSVYLPNCHTIEEEPLLIGMLGEFLNQSRI